MKNSLNTCLSRAICSVPSGGRAATAGGRSRVAWCSGCRHSRHGCGAQGRTAALKPRPAHRWPVRATDVHDVIQRTSGEGKLVVRGVGGVVTKLHIKSPLWPWQQLAARSFLSPAAWLGSGIPRSAAVEHWREWRGPGFSAEANLTRTGRSPRANPGSISPSSPSFRCPG